METQTMKIQTNQNIRSLFALEDNSRAISALEEVCKENGIALTLATNFADAEEKLNRNYDFHFFDLHVPYSDGTKTKSDKKFGEDFRKYMGELPVYLSSYDCLDIAFGDIPREILPIGFILARKMKDSEKNNFMITTSIFHDNEGHKLIQDTLNSKGILNYVGSFGTRGCNPKFEKNYWYAALDKALEVGK